MQLLATDALNCLRLLLKAGARINELCSFPIRKYKDIFMSEVDTNDSKPSLFQECFKLLQAAGELQGTIPPLGVKEHEILTLKDICKHVIRNHFIDLDPHTNLFCRVPELHLPSYLQSYLLNDVSLIIREPAEEKPGNDKDSHKREIGMVTLIPWIGENEILIGYLTIDIDGSLTLPSSLRRSLLF